MSSTSSEARPFLAAAWMMGGVISFSLMAIAGRVARSDFDTFEIMMYRSIFGIAIVLLLARMLNTHRSINTRRLRLHLTRNLFHFAGQNLWFYALPLIPLAQLFSYEFTTPLWVVLLSPLFLNERITFYKALSVTIGFLGILTITRPGFDEFDVGTMAAAAAAIGFAGTYIFSKQLVTIASLTCILFWMTLMQAIMGLAAAGIDGDIALPTIETLPWLAIISLCGLSAHYCITSALAIAPATIVAPLDFIRLPAIIIVGYLLYDEHVDGFIMAGALIILLANYMNIRTMNRS
ncbi:MAG: DMT family transporter [Roseovarius sp.]|nr:DMT family transporter [Roseovarius sp.]